MKKAPGDFKRSSGAVYLCVVYWNISIWKFDSKPYPSKIWKIRFNDSDIVTGGRGYNAWWSREYQRREADDLLEAIKQCRDSFIVIDNADCLINDDVRRFINFELSNQYMLFLRNCDGLNVSDKSFKVLKFDNNRITLEEELWYEIFMDRGYRCRTSLLEIS